VDSDFPAAWVTPGNPDGPPSYTPDTFCRISRAPGHLAADRATTLIRQLLASSREQHLVPRPLALNALLVALDPLLRRLVGDGVRVVTELAGDLGIVEADSGQLEQVILNLAANARDAMSGDGQLTLRTANVELGGGNCSAPAEVAAGPM
jgi:two-component system, cell cycle sensor histidine kinase and response regulator CckA